MAGVPIWHTPAQRAVLKDLQNQTAEFCEKVDLTKTLGKEFNPRSARSWGRACDELYVMTNSAKIIATTLGEHEAAELLGQFSVAFSQITIGMMGLSTGAVSTGAAAGGSLGALSTLGPYMAIASGAFVLASALFGSRDKQGGLAKAFEAIFAALQQIGKMLEQVLKNQVKTHKMLHVLVSLAFETQQQLSWHHEVVTTDLAFIKLKELHETLLRIQDDLAGKSAVGLSQKRKEDNILVLESWLKRHLFDPSMNMLSSASAPLKQTIDILNKHARSPWMMIGFVVAQLRSRLGSIIPGAYLNLPPLPLYMTALRMFLLARAQATDIHSPDGCESFCDDVALHIARYQAFMDFLKTNQPVWSAMFAQYEHRRNMVGRAIAAQDIKNTEVTLNVQATDELNRLQLMNSLDDMEACRLLIVTMANLVEMSPSDAMFARVASLESSSEILSMTGKAIHKERHGLIASVKSDDHEKVDACLRAGEALESTNPVNQIAHNIYFYGSRAYTDQMTSLSLMLKHAQGRATRAGKGLLGVDAGLVLHKPSGAGGGETTNGAMGLMVHHQLYDFALLQIAMGLKVENWMQRGWDNASRFMGSLPLSAVTRIEAAETMMILSSTIKPEGLLYREKLTVAMDYYLAFTRGELAIAESMRHEGVDPYCLLWVVCILGNWEVFESLASDFTDFGQTLGSFNFRRDSRMQCFTPWWGPSGQAWFTEEIAGPCHVAFSKSSFTTPLMMAALNGRVDVVEGLIAKQETGHDIGLGVCWEDGSSAAMRAFERGHFEVAKRLYKLGAPIELGQLPALISGSMRDKALLQPHIDSGLAIVKRGPLPPRLPLARVLIKDALTQDEVYLRAMAELVKMSKEALARDLPRAIKREIEAADVLKENRALRAEMAEMKQMMAQMMRQQALFLATTVGRADSIGPELT